jgi:regulator of sigma E protease
LISLSLAIFNLLPFLPLDGGHILFALIELFRRRPLAREVYERVSLIGIVAMLMLFAIGLSNDVTHITNGPGIGP